MRPRYRAPSTPAQVIQTTRDSVGETARQFAKAIGKGVRLELIDAQPYGVLQQVPNNVRRQIHDHVIEAPGGSYATIDLELPWTFGRGKRSGESIDPLRLSHLFELETLALEVKVNERLDLGVASFHRAQGLARRLLFGAAKESSIGQPRPSRFSDRGAAADGANHWSDSSWLVSQYRTRVEVVDGNGTVYPPIEYLRDVYNEPSTSGRDLD